MMKYGPGDVEQVQATAEEGKRRNSMRKKVGTGGLKNDEKMRNAKSEE